MTDRGCTGCNIRLARCTETIDLHKQASLRNPHAPIITIERPRIKAVMPRAPRREPAGPGHWPFLCPGRQRDGRCFPTEPSTGFGVGHKWFEGACVCVWQALWSRAEGLKFKYVKSFGPHASGIVFSYITSYHTLVYYIIIYSSLFHLCGGND